MAQDRVDSGLVAMTHDFLATMLGTNRSTVSLAAAILQKRKAIEYVRGAVKREFAVVNYGRSYDRTDVWVELNLPDRLPTSRGRR
jgi:Crp-like helix-turn-helix domain